MTLQQKPVMNPCGAEQRWSLRACVSLSGLGIGCGLFRRTYKGFGSLEQHEGKS